MKIFILGVVAAAFLLSAVPAQAEESIFDKASNWIKTWQAPCPASNTCGKQTAPAKEAKEAKSAPAVQGCTTDVLGNKVPTGSVK